MTKEIAKANNTAMAEYDWETDDGADGDVSAADLEIPYLSILQALSPQVADELDGAKPGELFNTATGEIYSGSVGVKFQPCFLQTVWVEWAPRDSGNGLVARHDPSSDFVRETIRANGQSYGKLTIEGSDNYLQETKYLYSLLLDENDEAEGFCIIPFTGSKLKKLRKFLTRTSQLKGRPKLFQVVGLAKTEKEKNDMGTFYNFHLDIDRVLTKEADADKIAEGYAFAKQVRDMDMGGDEPAEPPRASRQEPASAHELADEIPF